MVLRKSILTTLFLFVITSHCISQELKPEKVIEIKYNDFFYNISDIVVDCSGNYYVSSRADKSILLIDSYGKIIKKFGGDGRGPGEFVVGPENFVLTSDCKKLYAIDFTTNVVNSFDLDNEKKGKLIQKIPLFNIISKDNFIITSSPSNESIKNSIQIRDNNFKVIQEFDPEFKKKNLFFDLYYIRAISDNKMLVTFAFRNINQIYSIKGELLSQFKLDSVNDEAAATEVKDQKRYITVPENKLINNIQYHENYLYIVKNSEPKIIQVYNLNGQHITNLTNTEEIDLFKIFGNKLFLISGNTIKIINLKDYAVRN